MVNTNYALWLQGADGRFTRAGEIAGYSIGMASNGLIAATGRSSAAEWETQFYQITGGQLDEVAIVVNRLNEEGTPEECRVIEVAEGFDPAPFARRAPAIRADSARKLLLPGEIGPFRPYGRLSCGSLLQGSLWSGPSSSSCRWSPPQADRRGRRAGLPALSAFFPARGALHPGHA